MKNQNEKNPTQDSADDSIPGTADLPVDTSEKTESIVANIQEVAQELNNLSNSSHGSDTTPISGQPESSLEVGQAHPPETVATLQPVVTVATKATPIMRLKNLFSFRRFDKNKQPMPSPTTAQPTVRRKVSKAAVITLIVVSVLLILCAGTAGAAYLLGKPVYESGMKTMALAKQTYALAKSQDLVGAQAVLKDTQASLKETQANYQKLAFLKPAPFIGAYVKDGEAALKAADAGAMAGATAIDAVVPYADVLGFEGQGSFEGGTTEDRIVKMVETLDKVTPKMQEISEKINIVRSEMDTIDPNRYPETFRGIAIRSQIITARTLIDEAAVALTDARPLIEVLPAVLGYPDPKKYLILFQNDGELRPTGGFMSAFAIVTVDKGKVLPDRSDDIYSLDKKFSKTIAAPEVITKYLNEKVWHLRNMNLSPDYKVSMDTFKEYYDTLSGEPDIDGIIAIDTQVLKEMVEITGPLEVPGYGTFTVENDKRCNLPQIVCELEHIVDRPLATLVTNRKSDIMGPMMQSLLHKAMGGGKEQLSKLVPLGFKLMEEKHVLVYFKDERAQQGAEAFNLAGRIVDYPQDYLHINNANFGGAKSNFYIEENVEQEISVDQDGTVTKTVSLSYTHTEPGDNCNLEAGQLCLSGIQRDYFRVYVPKGSELIKGLGSEVDIQAHEELGKTYFDGFFILRPQSKAKVVLTYKLPFKVTNGQDYKLLMQKQPGTKDSNYTLTINGKEDSFMLGKDTEKVYKL